MTLPVLLLLAIGSLLIWGAVKDKNPVDAVKAILTGKPA